MWDDAGSLRNPMMNVRNKTELICIHTKRCRIMFLHTAWLHACVCVRVWALGARVRVSLCSIWLVFSAHSCGLLCSFSSRSACPCWLPWKTESIITVRFVVVQRCIRHTFSHIMFAAQPTLPNYTHTEFMQLPKNYHKWKNTKITK